MEALLKALAEALAPYLPTGDSGDLDDTKVQDAVQEFITGGGIESELESAVRSEVESEINNNDLIGQSDIERLIEDAVADAPGPTEETILEMIRDALNTVV